MAVLRDVELRLRALEESRRLHIMVRAAEEQVRTAKEGAAQAEPGSDRELSLLKEAAEASQRLSRLRERLFQVERELRRTAYLLDLLIETDPVS